MFSPSEYLTNLRQISLLNGLVTPQGQLPHLPQIPKMVSGPGIPVVATVPGIGVSTGECNDFIRTAATSPLVLGIAAAVAGALILTHLVRKHGPAVMQWFRQHAQQFIASIKARIKRQRATQLLSGTQSVVMA